ncbi:hypothetical protein MD484_g3245, partial [Candolleomyces efflorescens]
MSLSVPFADGRPVPLNVLESIAFHLVVAPEPSSTPSSTSPGLNLPVYYLYDPPKHLPPSLATAMSRLPPLLAVSKAVYQALSPGIASSRENGARYPLQTELYARLCCEFLDVKAVGRRWRGPMRRNRTSQDDGEDAWDKDVQGVPNAALTAHLVQVCRLLRFLLKAADEMDIPLPAQVLSEARLKKPSGRKGISLHNPGIENALISMVVLMMENDGKNHHQLRLVSAPLFIDFLVLRRLNEGSAIPLSGPGGVECRFNDGWPVESVLNTAAVWLLWLFTTPEKIACESQPLRERLISLLLPYALCPYRYASALVPPTHFTLPLLADTDDLFARPWATMTAHGSFPVYHAYPPCPLPTDSNASPSSSPTPATADASHTTITDEAAAAAPRIIAGQRVEEDSSNNNARRTQSQSQHEAASNGPSTSTPGAGTANVNAGSASTSATAAGATTNRLIRDRGNAAEGGSTTPANHSSSNSSSPSPRGSPVPQQPQQRRPGPVPILSRKPPPDKSNSQAHPSIGVRFPWYCSPYEEEEDDDATGSWEEGVRLGDITTSSTPSETSRANSRMSSRSASISSSSSSSLLPSTSLPTPRDSSMPPKQGMIVLYLPLISASAKLVYMSRREINPLPVLAHLPVDREAARGMQRRFAGPTQADMREVGQWCTWGRRGDVGVSVVPPAAAATAAAAGPTTTHATTTTTNPAPPVNPYAPPPGVDVNDDGMMYKDSQRWDVDWWRMRVCGGRQWFLRDKLPSTWQWSQTPSPSSSTSSLPPSPSPSSPSSPSLPLSLPLYRPLPDRTFNLNAYRAGTVYEKGMLTGLWQGYMHMPNENSLNYLVHNKLFANNFSEGTLGVMMRPMFMRLEEHVWVPSVEDPGRFGGGAKKGEHGSAKDESGEGEGDGEEYVYRDVGRKGCGPVPAAKPAIMSTIVVEEEVPQTESGQQNQRYMASFLDENMNNAWIPGPVASFKYEEGYTTPAGREMKAEDGVSDGVFRDRILVQQQQQQQHHDADDDQRQQQKMKMKSITMIIPDTYAPSVGMPWSIDGESRNAAGVAPAAGGGAPARAPDRRMAPLSPTPGSSDQIPVRFTMDNPNYRGHNVLPVNEEEEVKRVVVKGRKHVYETYHPLSPPGSGAVTTGAAGKEGERESVHERMERAEGREVCKSWRIVRRRRRALSHEEEGGDKDGVEQGLEGPGRVEEYVYAHPGCLKCKERERVVRMRVACERRKRKERARVMWEKRRREVESMFASVGLGRDDDFGRGDTFEDDEDEDEDKGVVLDLELNSEDVDMEDEEDFEEEEEEEEDEEDDDEDEDDDDMLSVSSSECEDVDDDYEDLDSDDVRNIERDIPPCKDIAEDIILTGGMDDRHAEAWGRFVYYGRVRPWDGLIGIVRMGVAPENAGTKFFFYGYIYGGRSFVGNWRYAAADPVVPSVESTFVFSRRADV